MNIKVCDVCYWSSKRTKFVDSKYRAGWKDGSNRIAIDTCEIHKNYLKQFYNFDEARIDLNKLEQESWPKSKVQIGKLVNAELTKP